METFGIMTMFEGGLILLMAGTWWRVLRRHEPYVGWRRVASLAGLALPTLALLIELGLTADVAHYGSLEASDAASVRGGWAALEARLWLWSFFAVGLLSLSGLILAIVAKGSPRLAAALWSFMVLGSFFVNLVLSVNSFH